MVFPLHGFWSSIVLSEISITSTLINFVIVMGLTGHYLVLMSRIQFLLLLMVDVAK